MSTSLLLVSGVLMGATVGVDGAPESIPSVRSEGRERTESPVRLEDKLLNAERPREWGEAVGGLMTGLTSSGSRFAAKTPVPVRLWVKNVSGEVKQIEHCGFWPNHTLRVTDADGRAVATTKQGALVHAAFKKSSVRKSVLVAVEPGAIDESYESYDLRDYFELPKGTIQVECESWLEGQKLLSNRLTLIIEK